MQVAEGKRLAGRAVVRWANARRRTLERFQYAGAQVPAEPLALDLGSRHQP
jgi:hypothetical protein